MATVCIETSLSSSIGGGVRLPSQGTIYTTWQADSPDIIRSINLKRFGLEVEPLPQELFATVLTDPDTNIQIVSNNGSFSLPGLYPSPKYHPILSKSGLVKLFSQFPELDTYIPKSFVLAQQEIEKETIVSKLSFIIENNFSGYPKLVIKHAGIDGNGNGVGFLDRDNGLSIVEQIEDSIQKFAKHSGDNQNKLFGHDYIVQEYVGNRLGEGSITFSVQNQSIDNWGLANNMVRNGEYFGSTNYFPYLTDFEKAHISQQFEKDITPLLQQLQAEGVRGNVGFDLMFCKQDNQVVIKVLESNGISRTTGSSMPNSFAYNTHNTYFAGIPLTPALLAGSYSSLSPESLCDLALVLESVGTIPGQAQIMNIKCEGVERGHPVVRVAAAGPSRKELPSLFYQSGLLNQAGTQQVEKIFHSLYNQTIHI